MSGAPAHLLSVIAICYNHERFVRECLESIRAQTYRDFELIIVDDASTDGSPQIIRQWIAATSVDCRLNVHASNAGLLRTLNEALAAASGRYVAVIAADDTWMPEKLARQVAIMESMPENVAVIYGDAEQMDEFGATQPERFLQAHGVSGSPPSGRLLSLLLERNFIPSMTTMVRTDALRAVGGYDERLAYEDWDMWLRLAQRYEFATFDYVSARYRILPSSLARTGAAWDTPNRLWSDLLIMEKCLGSAALGWRARIRLRLRILARAVRLLRRGDRRWPDGCGRALRAWV